VNYFFIFDINSHNSKQLNLCLPESIDKPKEIFGTIECRKENQQMSILSLSRGAGYCDSYRPYDLISLNNINITGFLQKELRFGLSRLSSQINIDYKYWPLVK
jgi:hypothetical protein